MRGAGGGSGITDPVVRVRVGRHKAEIGPPWEEPRTSPAPPSGSGRLRAPGDQSHTHTPLVGLPCMYMNSRAVHKASYIVLWLHLITLTRFKSLQSPVTGGARLQIRLCQ